MCIAPLFFPIYENIRKKRILRGYGNVYLTLHDTIETSLLYSENRTSIYTPLETTMGLSFCFYTIRNSTERGGIEHGGVVVDSARTRDDGE